MKIDGLFRGMDISISALMAERTMMNVTAQNVANMRTTHGRRVKDAAGNEGWEPYRRRVVSYSQGAPGITGSSELGVRVSDISEDYKTKFTEKFDPGHPDADENGYVRLPNVDLHVEMANMIMAKNAYDANATAMESAKNMIARGLRLLV